jgi:Ankyrin repeats (3 copies)
MYIKLQANEISVDKVSMSIELEEQLLEAARRGLLHNLQDAIARAKKNGDGIDKAKDHNDNTALILAASYGHASCVSALLAAGADKTIRNRDKRTALMEAEYNSHPDCMALLGDAIKINSSMPQDKRDEPQNSEITPAKVSIGPRARKREKDAGYKPHPLGTRNHPWPTRKRGEENGVRTFGLGVIQSDADPLWLHSAREYKHVLPELLRNMPVPGMLDAFEAILHNPLVYLESDPAYGKSYLANLIGNAMHPEGAVIYDASSNGGNLESLKFQTVFDSNANSDLMDRINSALRGGSLTSPSLKALRELKDKDGKALLSEEGSKRVFDWKGLEDSGITRKEIDDVLSSVQKYQEWNGGLRIGFKDVDGALIRAAKEHRPLVIDEFSRRKLGSEGALQRIWQCIAGEAGFEEVTVDCGNLGDFTLRYGDIPKVIMTANKAKDGAGVLELPDSVASRFVVKEIPAFTEEDWAHRISQVLTGVPITTLARLEKGRMLEGPNPEDAKWEIADHNKFRHNLESVRHANEVVVPRLQTKLLDHWQDVIAVSQALGRAYNESAALLDPESPVLQQSDMAGIRFEVDKPGDKAQKLTPRTALRSLKQAIQRMAESVPATQTQGADFSNWDMPNITPSKEPIEAKMGDRLRTLVEHWIDDVAGVTPDGARRPKLYAQLRKVWEEAGVIGADSVLDRLNIKSTAIAATTDEVRQAQAVINNYLKAKYPKFEGVSVQQVELFLKGLQNVPPKSLGEEKVQVAALASNPDLIQNGEFTQPIAVVTESLINSEVADLKKFLDQHSPETLVDQDKAISTLALPYIGKNLMQAIAKFNGKSEQEVQQAVAENDELKEAYQKALPVIFEGSSFKSALFYSSSSPCVITTTIARNSDNGTHAYAKLHVVHNKQTGKSLVVAFAKPTVEMGSDSSVTVVYAKDRDATKRVKLWLSANAQGTSDELREAFEERNAVPKDKASASLEALLTDTDTDTNKKIKTFSPTMLDGSHSTSRSV